MIILVGLALAVFVAAFGVVFLASAKAQSWLALAVFAACAVAVFTLPLADWLRQLASGPDLTWAMLIGLSGGVLCLWILHRAGITERLTERLSRNSQRRS